MLKARDIFVERFNASLTSQGIQDIKCKSFIIIPTNDVENYTSRDDIYRFWSTPRIIGIRIDYNLLVESLVKDEQNSIPLWVKITAKIDLPILLEISQRFRKVKEVIQRNSENNLAPFEIDNNSSIEYIIQNEREEAIRILFFTRSVDNGLLELIGDKIKYAEVEHFFKKHFENYRFYPPLYNHFKLEDMKYSRTVIEIDFKSKRYRIFKNDDQKETLYTNLNFDQALNYYLEYEQNWELNRIKILRPEIVIHEMVIFNDYGCKVLRKNNQIIVEYDSGGSASKMVEAEITEEELYELMKSEQDAYKVLLRAQSRQSGH